MPATINREALATRVLQYLRVLEGADVAEAEDQAVMLAKIDDAFAELRVRGVGYWPSDEIPLELVDALEQFIGARACRRFVVREEWASFEAAKDSSFNTLCSLTAEPYRARPIRASHI